MKETETSDVKYDSAKVQSEGQEFIDIFRKRMQGVADQVLGEIYSKCMPYIESDTWTNYREALRIELEHEYKFSNFKNEWATNFRRAVFVENREEISKLIEQDILKRIKQMEDNKQEYEMFRYTPLGHTYQDLKKECADYRDALEKLKRHHKFLPDCSCFTIAEPVLAKYPKETE